MKIAMAARETSDGCLLALACGLAAAASWCVGAVSASVAAVPAVAGAVGLSAVALLGWAALRRWTACHDAVLFPVTVALMGLGYAMLLQLPGELAQRQLLRAVIGLTVLVLVAAVGDLRPLVRHKYVCALLAVILLLATSLFGSTLQGGVRLSLSLGVTRFQPSEFVRILLVVFLAAYLAEKRAPLSRTSRRWWTIGRHDLRYLGPMAAMWALSLLLWVKQRDLGAALLFFGIFLIMVYIAASRPVYVVAGLALFATGVVTACRLFPHVNTRVRIWIDPWSQFDGKGYQLAQSMFALADGGLTGVGPGAGFVARIPAVHTDLIFCAVVESLGLAGGVLTLLLYLILVARGLTIALKCHDDTMSLLCAGLSAAIGLQVFVIVGGVIRLMPLTGITLPFLSYGGSSMVANGLLVGMLLAASREAPLCGAITPERSRG